MKKELNNILAPVDFNEPSLKATQYASNFALSINAEVIWLYVIQTFGLISDFFLYGEQLVKITDQAKDKLINLSKSMNKNERVKISSKVERGKAYESISKVAEENKVRMIVLGENHQGVDANRNLGSTVYHVTLKSPVPDLGLTASAVDDDLSKTLNTFVDPGNIFIK